MPTLIVTEPDGSTRRHALFKRVVSVGRGAGNDVVLADPSVADVALTLVADGPGWNAEALPGVELRVAGSRTRQALLQPGRPFEVGRTRLELSREEAPAPPATRAAGPREGLEALRTLHQFSRRLLGQYEIGRLLDDLMDAVIEVTRADKGFLILLEDGELRIKVARNLDRENIEHAVARVSDTIIARVVQDRRPLIVSDALHDAQFGASQSVMNLRLSSVMCAPMMDKGELLGLIYVGNDRVVDLFEPADLEVMTVFAAQASLLVTNALMVDSLRRETESLRHSLEEKRFGEIIGACDAMLDVFRKIDKVAATDISVLVTGETGTGKELVAREIHRRSRRASGPFVAINCGAIPENLLESELFGHVRGAFTGATSTRMGRFQAAHGGTLFLDEVGELPVSLQVKLLRALQEKSVTKVGETRAEAVDIRIIAATNKDLDEEMRRGTFREDLYYRLNVVSLHLPPLRERGDDVLVIARYLLDRFAREYGSRIRGFSQAGLKAMRRYAWPGNIRQLENRIRKAVVMAEKSLVGPDDLDLGESAFEAVVPLQEALERYKRDYINRVLERNAGNRTRTARELGVDPRTIFRHLERLGADGPDQA